MSRIAGRVPAGVAAGSGVDQAVVDRASHGHRRHAGQSRVEDVVGGSVVVPTGRAPHRRVRKLMLPRMRGEALTQWKPPWHDLLKAAASDEAVIRFTLRSVGAMRLWPRFQRALHMCNCLVFDEIARVEGISVFTRRSNHRAVHGFGLSRHVAVRRLPRVPAFRTAVPPNREWLSSCRWN